MEPHYCRERPKHSLSLSKKFAWAYLCGFQRWLLIMCAFRSLSSLVAENSEKLLDNPLLLGYSIIDDMYGACLRRLFPAA
jgi:hypothetical protein